MTIYGSNEPEAEPPPISAGTEEYPPYPVVTKKKTTSRWHTIWRVSVVAVVLILAAFLLPLYWEIPKVDKALEDALTTLRAQDADKALALFSDRAREYSNIKSDLESMFVETSLPFENYQEITILDVQVRRAFANDPRMPQGTIAFVEGYATYKGGMTVPISVILEKQDGDWRLYGIHFGPPPDEDGP
jgi:hypothetical protein